MLGDIATGTGPAPALPGVVRSFAQRATSAGAVPSTVRLRPRAEMRANPGDSWQQHIAEQVISVHDPGFVWLARVYLAALLSARILDAYVDGEGLIEVRLLGRCSWHGTRAASRSR
jgi:hypothetical protein